MQRSTRCACTPHSKLSTTTPRPVFERNAVETATLMRCIGLVLIRERRPDLWREVYQAYLASIWPDKDYVDGDETRFLDGSGTLPE